MQKVRHVTCSDCGARYDYSKDDFCPRCGTYNAPPGSGSTRLERELLSRFQDGQDNQRRVSPTVSATQPRRTAAARRANACEAPLKKNNGVLLLLIVAILAAATVAFLCVNQLQDQKPADVPAPTQGEVSLISYLPDTEFSVNDVSVTVYGAWWVSVERKPSTVREGYGCLAVDVAVKGGSRRDDLPISTPYLRLSDGTELPLEDDARLSGKLSSLGVYSVNLSDYQWEDPLVGQFVFYVPDWVQGEVTLVIEEYLPGPVDSPVLSAIHSVSLDLPSRN